RAFSRLENFVETAHPLLAPNGRMIAMKGPAAADEITSAESVICSLGYEILPQLTYSLPDGMGERTLIIIAANKAL
ncbi:MAG: RsmG family class I SAM-dependent methyltransferase, partial [Deltaproteobacteria bacterium]